MADAALRPVDVRCPTCTARPGFRCRTLSEPLRYTNPHQLRVVAARRASDAIARPRTVGIVSDAWSCPTCGFTAWPPATWSPRMWQAARDVAQLEHGRSHREEQAAAEADQH